MYRAKLWVPHSRPWPATPGVTCSGLATAAVASTLSAIVGPPRIATVLTTAALAASALTAAAATTATAASLSTAAATTAATATATATSAESREGQ